MGFHVDGLDRKILLFLYKDVRISVAEIARNCNVTGSAIHQRIQKLVENKIIDKKTYKPNIKTLGYNTLAFVGVQINLVEQRTHIQVFEHLKSIPEIVELHNITGKYSFLLKIYAKSNEHLKNLLVDKIQSVVEVVGTETFISLEEGFSRSLPFE
ncbi:MAG: hypothetical protein AUJ98_00255 [Bacteroidetes bacterium CG2_30_33_31]|nr:MAG: hypothetical protein AUJ98_00255 [Bacteroidetes bacterium CG2_30_33_31]